MFQRIIDGISASTGTTVRLTSLAAGAAFALFITTCFLCAAAFISVLETYGPVQACLAGAGIFFLLTLTAAGSYWGYKREMQKRARKVFWLDPEPRGYWDTGDSIVSEYAPYCDGVYEVRNLRQLQKFVADVVEA